MSFHPFSCSALTPGKPAIRSTEAISPNIATTNPAPAGDTPEITAIGARKVKIPRATKAVITPKTPNINASHGVIITTASRPPLGSCGSFAKYIPTVSIYESIELFRAINVTSFLLKHITEATIKSFSILIY